MNWKGEENDQIKQVEFDLKIKMFIESIYLIFFANINHVLISQPFDQN